MKALLETTPIFFQRSPKGARLKSIELYWELAKPRILAMVLVTTALGFFLGARRVDSVLHFCLTLFGVGCATGGAAMLNNFLERDLDAKMVRTRGRALPAGLIEPQRALALGVGLVLFGAVLLAWKVNLLTGFLVLLAGFLYVLVYTPLKRITWLNTSFGAIPGAIPPMVGWVAATGRLDAGAWVLFAILFAWQHPHFYAIAWMFREDYRAAGFAMLPVVEPSGKRMFRQTMASSIVLLAVSLLPTIVGITGMLYLCGALVSGALVLAAALRFACGRDVADARRLLRATILYLPTLLLLIALDVSI
jgi:protoheme IX farnesyltransferase